VISEPPPLNAEAAIVPLAVILPNAEYAPLIREFDTVPVVSSVALSAVNPDPFPVNEVAVTSPKPEYVPLKRAFGTVPDVRFVALAFPLKKGATTFPLSVHTLVDKSHCARATSNAFVFPSLSMVK
jgi:hypothetical protein